MNPSFCRVSREGPVTLVTIDRPEVLNALHSAAHFELSAVFDAFAADATQRVAILTGAGDRAFCSGNDLKAQAAGGPMARPPTGFGGIATRFDLNKPIIAAVNGVAMGGGFEMVLACDLAIACETASFGLPEPRVGMAALQGGLLRLPRQIPYKAAMGLILTGRRMEAREALALGLLNELTTPEDLLPAARRWAAQICECAPLSVEASREAVIRGLEHGRLEDAFAEQPQWEVIQRLRASDDFAEGPRAFRDRRKPVWTGR